MEILCKCGHEKSAHRDGQRECLVPLVSCYCENYEKAFFMYLDVDD